ncbi:MAG: cache domain-containing protein [Lachnospiraceae bacterium]|nr:cache domain-containing protein [Lachnospiraceae bacterium]
MKNNQIDRRRIIEIILMSLVIIGVLTINFVTIYSQSRDNIIRSCENDVLKQSSGIVAFLTESINTVDMSSYMMAEMMEGDATYEQLETFLETESAIALKTVEGSTSNGLYGFFNGEYVDGTGWVPDEDYEPTQRPWYTAAASMQGETVLVTPYVDAQTGTVMMSISKLLPDGKSVLALDLSLDGIQDDVVKNKAFGSWEAVMVLAPEAIVAAHSDGDEKGKDYSQEEDSLGSVIYKGLKESNGNHFDITYKGSQYCIFVADILSGWKLVTAVRSNVLLYSVNKLYVVFMLSIVVVFCMIFFVFRKIGLKKEQAEYLSRQLRAVVNVYFSVHLIDIRKDTYSVLSQSESVRSIIGDDTDRAQYRFRLVMDALTDPRYKSSIFEFIDFATLDERIGDKRCISKEFISNMNDRCCGRFVPVERDEDGHLTKVIWMVERIGTDGED